MRCMRFSIPGQAVIIRAASRTDEVDRIRPAVLKLPFASMASKRKRAEARPAPPSPEPPRRRSNRRSKGNDNGDTEAKVGSSRHIDRFASKEAVEQARHSLSEMEQRLLDEAKRQRLAIEASELQSMASTEGTDGISHGPKKIAKRAAKQRKEGNTDQENGHPEPEMFEEPAPVEDAAGDRGSRRPPPVNSDKLPLPWKGRLGYACLNTYLRTAHPPVFSSRTCRISSILEHRHPLQDPTQPEHPTKNRPDKTKQASVERGLKYVQELGLSNTRDIVKMLRWNEKFGIRFMRLSSEMFPFASHAEYGYSLTFAADELAGAGKVASELGHRLTTHPGQFTQIGSPRKEVVTASIRDLEYHNEMLALLKLSDRLDRDAVMILHMGGTFGDKDATLERFRQNYYKLSTGVQKRLVLENDDVSWSVHDLLPICEELNIPLVLDYHHHNIVFDPSLREGTLDIIQLYDRIRATWTRKNITQKMHYSEPTPSAITPRDRRKHSPRVKTLPPCANDMDLMIEAKDKEQAVFDLMRHFKLPGWDLTNNIVPYERDDESKKAVKKKGQKSSKSKKKTNGVEPEDDIESPERVVDPEDVGMGGPDGRVYWPEGMEEWLKPKKREGKNGVPNGTKKSDEVLDGE